MNRAGHGPDEQWHERVTEMIEKENQSREETDPESVETQEQTGTTGDSGEEQKIGEIEFVDADDVEVDDESEPETEEVESEAPEEAAPEDEPDSPVEATPEAGAEAAPESEPEAGPAAEEPEDTGPPKRWYVVHTYSGHENKVKENIQKMINTSRVKDHFGQIIVPTEEVAEMKKGKKTITTKKFFPSYILIEMHMSDESRHLVSDIPGVTSFVGTASGPQPLSKAEVERILGRMDKEKQTIIPDIPFTLGEHIRIKDGPFSDFTGIIDEINAERGKLKVLVSIFGRETPVELDFLQVENL